PIVSTHKSTKCDRHSSCVRELHADRVLARYWRQNIDALVAGGARHIAFQTDNFVHADAFGWIDFVACDRWPFGDVAGRHRNSKLCERVDQSLLDPLQLAGIGASAAFWIVLVEQVEPGKHISFRIPGSTR